MNTIKNIHININVKFEFVLRLLTMKNLVGISKSQSLKSNEDVHLLIAIYEQIFLS